MDGSGKITVKIDEICSLVIQNQISTILKCTYQVWWGKNPLIIDIYSIYYDRQQTNKHVDNQDETVISNQYCVVGHKKIQIFLFL